AAGRELLGGGIALGARRGALGELARACLEFARQRDRHDLPDLFEIRELQAAGGERGRADAKARRLDRRARVERDRVAVDGDADLVQAVLGLLARELRLDRAQVDE